MPFVFVGACKGTVLPYVSVYSHTYLYCLCVHVCIFAVQAQPSACTWEQSHGLLSEGPGGKESPGCYSLSDLITT